jgi:hypothetical protein
VRQPVTRPGSGCWPVSLPPSGAAVGRVTTAMLEAGTASRWYCCTAERIDDEPHIDEPRPGSHSPRDGNPTTTGLMAAKPLVEESPDQDAGRERPGVCCSGHPLLGPVGSPARGPAASLAVAAKLRASDRNRMLEALERGSRCCAHAGRWQPLWQPRR